MAHFQKYGLYLVFTAALVLNISFWLKAKHVQEVWDNVPPPPAPVYLSMMSLGDDQIAYRMTGYFLQNLGSAGGRYEPLKDYNFENLEKWLFVANELDPRSNYIPYLVAFFFSATQDKTQVRYLVNYLHANGQTEGANKWRWSGQAAYLAQFILEDNELALKIAEDLAKRPGVADWAKQLPALISLRMGNKDKAYGILLSMLNTERDNLDPAEINTILDIICNRTLDRAAAAQNPLCQDLK